MTHDDKTPKILIVDDNKQNIELLMGLFKSKYKVSAAINAGRALKIARSDSQPDIILLDIVMPDMNGYEICRELKNDEKTKNIPVIFVTAVSEVMDSSLGFALGAVDYITKPFHPPMVEARVKLHLELKRKQELLEEYAYIDALTEIPNRRSFEQAARREWNRAQRSGRTLSVLLMDIDHFKEYNDTYGHGKGDDCLRRAAKTIQGALRRAGDFAARYGGEEFSALLPYTDRDDSWEIARNILRVVEEENIPHKASPVADHITISCGITTVEADRKVSIEEILDAADRALYKAKHSGRNAVAEASVSE